MKKKIKCNHCKYEWESESKMIFVSCPSCLKKVNIQKVKGGKKEEK